MPNTSSPTQQWDEQLLKNPHAVADKRSRVQRMFANIAPSYDLNNRLHSLWMDQYWRRTAVTLAQVQPADTVVDVACGTGDLSLKFATSLCLSAIERSTCRPRFGQVIGVDFTYEMLPIARRKSDQIDQETAGGDESDRLWPGLVQFVNGDALALPLPDALADVISIAFGIRNVIDPAAAIREFYRVLKPGGRLIILEFSLPTNPLLRGLYNFYFRKVLPRTASLISGDKTGAYKYLPESVNTFISRDTMTGMMAAAGLTEVQQFPLTFGVCVCYRGIKRV
jgi:demethylmenaquinone methyltransferase/2-methoxy-6-polyprenyl-1,4-benzoquinol methylase